MDALVRDLLNTRTAAGCTTARCVVGKDIMLCSMPTQDYVPTNEELDAALKGAKVKCKVLLLTNPSNPLGIVFSRYTITTWHVTRGQACDTAPAWATAWQDAWWVCDVHTARYQRSDGAHGHVGPAERSPRGVG
jgi:hypothetical protein